MPMNWAQRTLASWIGLGGLDEVVRYANAQLSGTADYSNISSRTKLEIIFSNPALLKVFSLQCELFSLGKIYVYDKNDVEIPNDPFLEMIKKPNPFQTEAQMKWDFMFWQMVGNSYHYIESKFVDPDNKMYFLDSYKIQRPVEMGKWRDRIVLTKGQEDEINNTQVEYQYADGDSVKLKWGNIIHIPDLTNGTGDWFEGKSRIDALVKIIANSEHALDAKNINLRFSGKFLVAGQADPKDTSVEGLPMNEVEKQDIETKMNGIKSVHAIKSMIDIKRFVENIGNLKLDESYLASYYAIGMAYNIPKDVLEAYESGTFENQEKARGAHVSYCLQPKGDVWFESHADFFGYGKEGKRIVMDWEHLPFMQVFAKDRAETNKIVSETVVNYVKLGLPIDEINSLLDLDLKDIDYERAERTGRTQSNNE